MAYEMIFGEPFFALDAVKQKCPAYFTPGISLEVLGGQRGAGFPAIGRGNG